jgi:hypothetical protein
MNVFTKRIILEVFLALWGEIKGLLSNCYHLFSYNFKLRETLQKWDKEFLIPSPQIYQVNWFLFYLLYYSLCI